MTRSSIFAPETGLLRGSGVAGLSTAYPHQNAVSLAESAFFNILLTRPVLTTYHTLRCLVEGISRSLAGRTIAGAFTQEKHRLHVAFQDTTEHLVVDCTPLRSTIYLHPRTARARHNSAALLPALTGRVVRSAVLHPSDRIVSIACDGNITLHALLYGTKANALLTDETGAVTDAFQDARTLAGTAFVLPAADVRVIDLDALGRALLGGGADSVRTILRAHLPAFGPDLLREVLARAGTDPALSSSALSDRDADALIGAVMTVTRDLSETAPRVYLDAAGEQVVAFSLIPLILPEGAQERRFDDVHEAVRFTLSRSRATRAVDTRRDALAAALAASCERARRTSSALEAELASAERSAAFERMGNLLMAHAAEIPRGAVTADLADDRGTVTIALEPHRSAMENARRYFDRAKAARRARMEAGQRLELVRAKLKQAAALLDEVQALTTTEEIAAFLRRQAETLPSFGVSAAGEPVTAPLFRTFRVEGGFEVLAGKSSTNNDLLTLKHARPEDLWFHARGGSGSHVVLRVRSARGEPGRAAREQAAAIAAHYSSLKTSRIAPVAMTLRKYVRKPKGAPPGTVTIEREEVLFVTPGLPPEGAV